MEPREENWREESWEDYTGPQVQYRAFTGEGEACDSPQRGSEGCDGPQGQRRAFTSEGEACNSLPRREGDSTSEGEACDSPQGGSDADSL